MQKSHEWIDHQCIGQIKPTSALIAACEPVKSNPRAHPMFDLDRFTADCRAARAADRSSKTICEVVKRAVSDPTGLLKSLGEPDRAGIKEIHRSPDLSILSVVWAPRMMIMPHNHHMWAVIGVYCGREDNIFWRRIAEAGEGQLEAAGARSPSKTSSRSATTSSTRSPIPHPSSPPHCTSMAAISSPLPAASGTRTRCPITLPTATAPAKSLRKPTGAVPRGLT
jgi:hypothetical protein